MDCCYLVVAAVVAAVFAAGCSGGEDDGGPNGGAETGTPEAVLSPSAPASPSATAPATGTPTMTGVTTAAGSATVETPRRGPETTPVPSPIAPTPVAPTATAVPPTPTATAVPAEDGTFVVTLSQGGASASVTVEIAATLAERQLGLMLRTELGEDAGMLFLFPAEGQGGFWMRNTLIPLDIAYIGADLRVIVVKQGKPLDETALLPGAPYLYVIEVNAGWFERHGLGPGAAVTLPGGLPIATAD